MKVGKFNKSLKTTLFLFSAIILLVMCLNVTRCTAIKVPALAPSPLRILTPPSGSSPPSNTENYNGIRDTNMAGDVSTNQVIRHIECWKF